MKSFLIGYYGFGNAGDERLLNRTVVLLKEVYPVSQVCALVSASFKQKSASPFYTSRVLGEITYCSRRSIGRLLQAFWRCDQVVFGGGGIFQDATSFRSLVYYAALVFLARLFGKKVVLVAQGIGPFQRRGSVRVMQWVCRCVTLCSVRDEASQALLIWLGMPADKVSVTADLAYYREKLVAPSLEKAPLVGLSFRASNPELMAALWPVLAGMPEDFLFLDLQDKQDQHTLSDQLEDKLVGIIPSGQIFERKGESSLLDTYRCQAVIAMRYHACVWASLQGIPFLALAYDDKVKALAEMCGQEWVSMTQEPGAFVEEFSRKWERLKNKGDQNPLGEKTTLLIQHSQRNQDIFL